MSVAPLRAVIYARYSSENQREASIDDQVRQCKAIIDDKGWTFVRSYEDRAMSGASAFRPAYQAMREDSRARRFDVAVAVSLDRFSRDQEDTAGLYKRLKHLGIPIVTIAEGEITPLHIAFAGAMNSMAQTLLAEKTWTGLEGRVLQGLLGRRYFLWLPFRRHPERPRGRRLQGGQGGSRLSRHRRGAG